VNNVIGRASFKLFDDSAIFLRAEGYGRVLIGRMRQLKKKSLFRPDEFPLILGRDFAGEVVAKGTGVADFNVGDVVMGVVAPYERGCHAEYVTVIKNQVKTYKIRINRAKFSQTVVELFVFLNG